MATLIHDRDLEDQLIARRQRLGLDHSDEVWNGVYVMSPMANIQHQDLVGDLTIILGVVIRLKGLGSVHPGVNVSDRREDWKKNYRVPDVAVFLNDTTAIHCGTHWCGGPDLAIEIASPDERCEDKLDFYSAVKTRELLIVNRFPWSLDLYRLTGDQLQLVGSSTATTDEPLASEVVPLTLRLLPGPDRPKIELSHAGGQQWTI
jgi:Uma2 family endonuclease